MPRRTRNVAFLQFDAKSFCAALTVVVLSSMLANDSIPRDGKGALMQVWKIAITSPTGTFDATLNFDPKLSPPAGEMRARNGSGPMSDLKLGFTAFQKKPEYGPGKIKITGLTTNNIEVPFLIEQSSTMIVDNINIESISGRVEDILYGNVYGKNSK